ncbi:MAG: hypothetical protein VB137_08960, partial [Burkholderia sp.]
VLPDARDVFDSSIFGFLRAYITASDRFCIPTVLVAAQRLTLFERRSHSIIIRSFCFLEHP